jgi:CRISPR-associated protein Cmr3
LIGKPYLISGWDYANNKPKGNRYGIPEGSVYFVKFEGEFNWAKPYLKFGELNKLGY